MRQHLQALDSRAAPIIEAALVYAAMMLVYRPLALSLGGGAASGAIAKLLVFILAPLAWVLVSRRQPAGFGLSFGLPAHSFRLALWAYRVIGPGCLVFPLMAWVGSSPDQWVGSLMASAVFAAALPLVVKSTANLPSRDVPAGGLATVVLLVSMATATSALTATSAPIVSRILYYGVVVGFSEEIAFRGFLQSLLNRGFGRPWQCRGVHFGPGLPIAALLFGLAHSIVGSGFHLPQAIFTVVLGLTFGYLRDKSGSVLGPAILHGLADLPLAFFGSP